MKEGTQLLVGWVCGTLDSQASEKVTFFRRAFIGSIAGPSGFVVSMSNVELVLKILALIAGIAVSTISFFSIWKSRKDKKQLAAIEIARKERQICDECRSGLRPLHCPLPSADRPPDCPHKNKK